MGGTLREAEAGSDDEEVEKMNHYWLIPALLRYLVGCEESVFSLLLVSQCSNLLVKGNRLHQSPYAESASPPVVVGD